MPRGRPEKPEEDRVVARLFTLSRDLTDDVTATVPWGKRSAFVQEAIRRELARLKKKQANG